VTDTDLDLLIVGAGFGGLYMLHRARGLGLRARVLEAGSGVGGTWYWNRYPGARCDIESMQYSYQFCDRLQQEWEWTERYATQPEILRYAEHVADRFDLRRDIRFDTRVKSAAFDETSRCWTLETEGGERFSATWCVMATGCLSAPNMPRIEGVGRFEGEPYHTGLWPHEDVDFSGKRVAVIGTGSSAIQSIPIIASQAKSVVVFQRTANYAVPAQNHPLSPAFQQAIKADYAGFRARARAPFSRNP
jgi:cation diffusion facilitator CzcD-associated flavoprotein CzcO